VSCEPKKLTHTQCENLAGKRFGRWSVISLDESSKRVKWLCVCDCGNKRSVYAFCLKDGQSGSCGCGRNEKVTRHGMFGTKIYRIWAGILERCNPKNTSNRRYSHNYAARGITVCDRWKDFVNFYADMGDPPEGMSIDRIDNDGNYCPENCRWASRKTQANNTRKNKIVEIDSEKMTVKQAAERFGVKYTTLYRRIFVAGMSPQESVKSPVRKWIRAENKQ
jgi:hypothetical protein